MADQTHGNSDKTQTQRPLQQQAAEPQGPQVELESPAAALQRGRSAPPASLSPEDVLALQRTVGNQGVQTILSQRVPAAERFGVWQPRSEPLVEQPGEEKEEEIVEASPRVSVAERLGAFPASGLRPEHAAPAGRRSSPLVPVDASSAGGCVICQNKKLAVWLNPTNPTCVVGCMRAHEQKHVDDFTADANYKNKCASIPDGETFYYASGADAKRFEWPAIDLEIDCLKKQLKNTTNASDKSIMQTRITTTLPNYKASFTG